jgi:uncharacterized protein (TIGR02996 family)
VNLHGHPEWESLLAGIVADPCSDLPRLVAADWLEEFAYHLEDRRCWEERAELIRVQCELAHTKPDSKEYSTLQFRETRLLSPMNIHRLFWMMEACPQVIRIYPFKRGMVVNQETELHFRRGFVERLRCPAREWLEHHHEIRSRQPIMEIEVIVDLGLSEDERFELRQAMIIRPQ